MKPSTSSTRSEGWPGSAFSLIELLAVMAVMALLAGLAADGFVERRKRSNRQVEAAELARLSGAWIQVALRFRSLPAVTNWVDWLAAGCTVPAARIARNGSGTQRQLVYDPSARFGRPLGPCPFTQETAGSLEPVSPRLLLVSSLGEELPDLGALAFDALWETPPDGFPPGWPANWAGDARDLLMERLDLRTRFHRVVLHNVELDTDATYAVLQRSAPVPPGGRVEGWFWSGSPLELRATDEAIQTVELIHQDCSFVFERRRWRSQIHDGPVRAGGVGALADQFLSTGIPPGAGRSATDQAVVVDEMVGFLNAFSNWGAEGFPGGGVGASPHPLHRSVGEAQARLRDFSQHLVRP